MGAGNICSYGNLLYQLAYHAGLKRAFRDNKGVPPAGFSAEGSPVAVAGSNPQDAIIASEAKRMDKDRNGIVTLFEAKEYLKTEAGFFDDLTPVNKENPNQLKYNNQKAKSLSIAISGKRDLDEAPRKYEDPIFGDDEQLLAVTYDENKNAVKAQTIKTRPSDLCGPVTLCAIGQVASDLAFQAGAKRASYPEQDAYRREAAKRNAEFSHIDASRANAVYHTDEARKMDANKDGDVTVKELRGYLDAEAELFGKKNWGYGFSDVGQEKVQTESKTLRRILNGDPDRQFITPVKDSDVLLKISYDGKWDMDTVKTAQPFGACDSQLERN